VRWAGVPEFDRRALRSAREWLFLCVCASPEAEEAAGRTLQRVKDETPIGPRRIEMVESAETILFYKFPQFSTKELERMFNLVDFKDTAVYREAFSEGEAEGEKRGEKKGSLNAVPLLLEGGFSVERIAETLNLDVDDVRQVAALAPSAKGARSG
jgi:predicted transposase YdaD